MTLYKEKSKKMTIKMKIKKIKNWKIRIILYAPLKILLTPAIKELLKSKRDKCFIYQLLITIMSIALEIRIWL